MSKVEVIETKHKVYKPIRIILETEEEFLNVWKALNKGGSELYSLWHQMNIVAEAEDIEV